MPKLEGVWDSGLQMAAAVGVSVGDVLLMRRFSIA